MKFIFSFFFFVIFFLNNLFSQTIATGAVSSPKCAGSTFNLSFTKSGTFTAGNVFTAQLSNASGSFTNPINIGTLTSTAAGTIVCTIPTSTTTGAGYRVRVVSSAPVKTGSVNNSNVTINRFNPDLFLIDTIRVCGLSYELSASSGYSNYIWSNGLTGQTITCNNNGWYKCSVSNGTCTGSDSVYLLFRNVDILNNDTVICYGQNISLITNSNSNLIWSNNSTSPSINFQPLESGFQFCYINDGTYSCKDSVNIKVDNPKIIGDSNVCINSNVILTGSDSSGQINSWSSSNPDIAQVYQSYSYNNATVYPSSLGTTTITYVNSFGCPTNLNITINSLPDVSFIANPSTNICFGNSLTLNGVGAQTYYWDNGIINNIPFQPEYTISLNSYKQLPGSGGYENTQEVINRIFVGDLNGDGKSDYIGSDFYSNPRYNGRWSYNIYQNISSDNNIENLTYQLMNSFSCEFYNANSGHYNVIDINNDGKKDIVTNCLVYINQSTISSISFVFLPQVTSNNSNFIFQNNQLTSATNNIIPEGNHGDFNGDGKADIINYVSGSKSITFFENLSTIDSVIYGQPVVMNFLTEPSNLDMSLIQCIIFDADGDGDVEIVYISSNRKIGIIDFSDPSGHIHSNSFSNIYFNSFAREIELHDLNSDGKLDIVVRGRTGEAESFSFKKLNANPNYTLYGISEFGCSNSVNASISLQQNFTAELFSSDTLKICGNQYLLQAADGYSKYTWNTGDTTNSITITASGLYKCKVSNGACESLDSIYVNILNAGIKNNDTAICSGQNVNLQVFATEQKSTTDIDGNIYPIVNIGSQSWLQRNLSVSRFRNGNSILNQTDSILWENSSSAWCNYYNNFQSYKSGKLYNWYAANDPSGLAPVGWHLPSSNEFLILANYLGGDLIAGGKLKDTGYLNWNYPNIDATNQVGFNAYGVGARVNGFIYSGENTSYWTTNYDFHDFGVYRNLNHNNSKFNEGFFFKNSGFSVRCIKDVPDTSRNFSYLWSTNSNSKNIIVNPILSNVYYCTISNGIGTCVDSVKVNVNSTIPSAPLSISGSTDVCPHFSSNNVSTPVRYSVKKVNNANSYNWTVPTGATIISGQGDTAIDVTFTNRFVSGVVSVKSVNGCGSSTSARTLAVYKRTSTTPAAIQKEFSPVSIAAVTNVCGLNSSVYKIKKVNYATSYNWYLNLGTNASISHLNSPGVNDTAVMVTFLNGFKKDTLCVKSLTACNASIAKSIVLNATILPTTVASISGIQTPCIGETITYSAIASMPTILQTAIRIFHWTKPNYTTILSANADSSVINLKFNTGFTGGSISVKGESACGIIGSAKTVTLQYLTPTPTSIASSTGAYNACVGVSVNYTAVVPAPTAPQRIASVYRWTKPNNSVILNSNADSSSISLQFNTGYIGGSISVKGQTACGITGSAKTQALTHVACSPGTKLDPIFSDKNKDRFNVIISPNPTTTEFSLKVTNAHFNKNIEIKIRDVEGRLIKSFFTTSNQSILFGNDLLSGVYMLEISNGLNKKIIRAVKY